MKNNPNMKVLLIEDSEEIIESETLCIQMRWPESEVHTAPDGGTGLSKMETENYDAVILDINLPDINGFEVLRRARAFTSVPIIVVSVRGSEDDKVRGLELGADDYIAKPFLPRDLIARINAVVRRTHAANPAPVNSRISVGTLTLNLFSNEVDLAGKTMKLTPTESRLLYLLMQKPEKTVSMDELSRGIWGESSEDTELLRTYVRRLRDKLHDNPPRIIVTERGEGYRLISPRSN